MTARAAAQRPLPWQLWRSEADKRETAGEGETWLTSLNVVALYLGRANVRRRRKTAGAQRGRLPQMSDSTLRIKAADKQIRSLADPIGRFLTEGFHLLGLFAIGAATVWAAAAAFYGMMKRGSPSIEDLLLLFIYLEIGSMVGIYFRTNHMPVRFLIYVGITALTRHMIGFVQEQSGADLGVLILAGATLILALAVLVIRFTSSRFPSLSDGEFGRSGVGVD
jgi:protein PsiE